MKIHIELDSIADLEAFLAVCRGERPDAEVLTRLRTDLKKDTDTLRAEVEAASGLPPTPTTGD